jgi:glycosyltransferase involved in cell wall biosynthesis
LHTDPKVSVIIPTRNRAHVLRRSIESVLAQTVDSLELIVVDDASDDDTESVVKAINDPKVRYVRCDCHRGAPAARNAGIRLARGQYLAFHDSDDEWLPNKLDRQLELIERRAPFADVVTCGTIRTRPDGRERIAIAASETLSYDSLLAFGEPFWGGPTILVRRTAATCQVFFDESLPAGQDWDYVVRLAQVARVVSVREPLVKVGRVAGDRVSTQLKKLEGRKLLRNKHESELRRYPHALAEHEIGIAKWSISCGEYTEGRRRLVNALRIRPFRPRVVALFFGSFLSQSPALRKLLRRRSKAITKGGIPR